MRLAAILLASALSLAAIHQAAGWADRVRAVERRTDALELVCHATEPEPVSSPAAVTAPGPVRYGIASVFAHRGDALVGGVSRCLGRVPNATDWGLATRTGECGDLYVVTNLRTGLSVVAPRIDAGPYGALVDGVWTIKKNRRDPGTWRGIADLTPAVAAAIGSDGWERIQLEKL